MANIERLTRLAELLEALPKEKKFDLGNWANSGPECGTVACACGWAALDPWFQRRGFSLLDLYTGAKLKSARAITGATKAGHPVMIGHDGLSGMEAAESFFAITEKQAYGHFHPDGFSYRDNVTAAQVARKLRRTFKLAASTGATS